ncbi:MAG: hypothetical protein WD077_02000 [Bacteroidia bacterium]
MKPVLSGVDHVSTSRTFALIFSIIFHPVLFPFYAFALLVGAGRNEVVLPILHHRTEILLLILGMTVLPIIFVLAMKRDIMLRNQEQRTIPYIITLLIYIAGGLVAFWLALPILLVALIFSATVSLFVLMVLNLKLKASMHTFSVGGIMGILMFSGWFEESLYWKLWLGAGLLALLVMRVRLILKAHTLPEIAAGFMAGLVPVFIGLKIAGY